MSGQVVRVLTIFVFASSLLCQELPSHPRRDAALLDVLTRTVSASGGAQAIAAARDLTASGEITFHWGEGVNGPVVIRALGGNHFHMEADLPEGKRTWVVKDGDGSRTEPDGRIIQISGENAINFGNLTFPVAHLAVALSDVASDVSLMGIEKHEGRSVYRLRLKGQLGLVGKADASRAVTKDVLVDALDFGIVSVQDYPYPVYQGNGQLSDIPPREIQYGDFRVVDGVRIPFSIDTKLQGQPVMSIRLNRVSFNSGLSDEDFKK